MIIRVTKVLSHKSILSSTVPLCGEKLSSKLKVLSVKVYQTFLGEIILVTKKH